MEDISMINQFVINKKEIRKIERYKDEERQKDIKMNLERYQNDKVMIILQDVYQIIHISKIIIN